MSHCGVAFDCKYRGGEATASMEESSADETEMRENRFFFVAFPGVCRAARLTLNLLFCRGVSSWAVERKGDSH